jgi:hypothetical protein
MKKFIVAFVAVLFISISVMAPSAEAVVFPNGMANQCCSPYTNMPVCGGGWQPAGSQCTCVGVPGFGYAC